MKKWLYAGTALLFVQLVLAVALNAAHWGDLAAFTPHVNLLHFSPAEVDAITIYGEKGQQATIRKVNGTWLLPELFKAPADVGKVEGLLQKLASLKQGLAVATTKGAANRFKVGADDFERHVILKNGDRTVADFFLGTSPEFRMVHARVHGRPEVVSVKLSTYEVGAEPVRWLDHGLAQVEKGKISSLTMGDIALARQGHSWRLAGLPANKELDTSQVDHLLEKIGSLTVAGVLDPAANKKLFKQEPALTIALTLTGNGKRTYTFAKPAKGDDYVLKTSAYNYDFKVAPWVVDGIKKFTKKSLMKAKKVAAAAKHQSASHAGKR